MLCLACCLALAACLRTASAAAAMPDEGAAAAKVTPAMAAAAKQAATARLQAALERTAGSGTVAEQVIVYDSITDPRCQPLNIASASCARSSNMRIMLAVSVVLQSPTRYQIWHAATSAGHHSAAAPRGGGGGRQATGSSSGGPAAAAEGARAPQAPKVLALQ